MLYILIYILLSTGIFLIFRHIENIKLKTFHVIVINYIVAGLLSFMFSEIDINTNILKADWLIWALMIGFLFITMFQVIATTTQKLGIPVATISSKMSVVIPIIFSIFFYQETLTYLKIIGISLAILSIYLTVFKTKKEKLNLKYLPYLILLFFGAGTIDSIMKYTEHAHLDEKSLPLFSMTLFSFAGILGILYLVFKGIKIKQFYNFKLWFWGVLLGIINYGTVFSIVNSLKKSGLDSSIVFGLNNIGTVVFSVVFALILFKEKLSLINWLGIILSCIAIAILTQ